VLYPDAAVPENEPVPPRTSPAAPSSLLGNTLNKLPTLPGETCWFFNIKGCLCIDSHNFQATQRDKHGIYKEELLYSNFVITALQLLA